MIYRLIPPKWLLNKPIMEGEFTDAQIKEYNAEGYNVYYLPNHPKVYVKGTVIDGTHTDVWNWVFCDFDLKDNSYPSKDAFIEALGDSGITPTKIIDSGNGVHAYWKITNLDPMSYLRFCRRLIRRFNTDDSIATLYRLMRAPDTMNTKVQGSYVPCVQSYCTDVQYTCEELDRLLPPITADDEKYCVDHYERTFNINQTVVDDTLPPKFGKLLRDSAEAKDIWTGDSEDRSKSDYRLGHLMFANGFTKEEASSVLVNSAKALTRTPVHRQSYAKNIVDKIWTFELTDNKEGLDLSSSVKDILQASGDRLEGTRIPCWTYIDDTKCGFRLGHVMGLVAGAGVGKTAMALNIFLGFVRSNPDFDHFFVPLEQTDREIASRWKAMCGNDTRLHAKVHVISNYNDNGVFRDLSLTDIKDYILKFTKNTGKQVGCVVIDHIGILCNNNRLGQDEGVKEISKAMKGFAQETNTFLIMQSQTSRAKAGIGDIELDKDAAFGTSTFENFCDYLVTLWQPLKRVYDLGAPTIMSYKFCKIRHKKQGYDTILEDKPYSVFFQPETQLIRPLTQAENDNLNYWVGQATNKRKADKKTDIVQYTSIRWEENEISRTVNVSEIRETDLPKSSNQSK